MGAIIIPDETQAETLGAVAAAALYPHPDWHGGRV